MPLVSTRGAASAKAFGWTGKTGGAGYTYVYHTGNNTASINGGTTLLGATALPVQPPNANLNRTIGIVAVGTFIASVRYYSLNNGASWSQWGSQPQTAMNTAWGLNGSIAYSPVSKRVMTAFTGANKSGYTCIPYTVSTTGSTLGATPFSIGPSAQFYTVSYSPAFNYFYVNNWGGGGNLNEQRYFDATTIAGGGSMNPGITSNFRAGISKDGYPLLAINLGGSTFQLREYTSADLSTYTSLGTISGISNVLSSPIYWLPVNNKYIIAQGNAANVAVATSTSASPSSFSIIGSYNYGGPSIVCVNIFEDAAGMLILSGQATFNYPKGGSFTQNIAAKSVDGGVSWTGTGAILGASKNFS